MRTSSRRWPLTLVLVILILSGGIGAPSRSVASEDGPGPRVEFNRDIRPILSETCFQCHGPDEATRKAGLRLDTEEGAFADLGGYAALVPGDLDESELYRRITSDDEWERMPPKGSGSSLSDEQIDLLRLWIAQGAEWQPHWSLMPPDRPTLPDVQDQDWPRNAIDWFILARLEQEGLAPSPEASKTTLIRRVTFDLTGLPPTPHEIDAFLADDSPDAYENLVDRLLASPRYGERMAIRWLDAARYADTHGYQTDGERIMWRWRDWVIDAFNRNLPFDQFTIEQIAGDMLPEPSLDQLIATGFNRNHRGNSEGGIIPEEYAVEYVADRLDTTATVWLGLTIQCARCHDHKYDPISQKEFYQLFAYFNNVPERGKAIKYGNSPPVIASPTPDQQEQLAALDAQLEAAENHFEQLRDELADAQQQWEHALSGSEALDWSPPDHLIAHFAFENETANALDASAAPAQFRDGEPAFTSGRIGQAAEFDGNLYLDAGDVADFGFYDAFTLAAWIKPAPELQGTIVARMIDEDQGEGFQLRLQDGKVQLNLVKRWLDDALRVETQRALEPDRWYHVVATYDGSRIADGVKLFIDGQAEPLAIQLDDLNQSFQTAQPLRIGGGGGPEGRFRGLIDEVRVFDKALAAEDVAIVALPETITEIVGGAPHHRSEAQARKVQRYFLETLAPEEIQRAWRQVVNQRQRRARLVASFPTTMIMREMDPPRQTFVLARGEYDKPTEKVEPGLPEVLPPLPDGVPNNRLGFAHWLVDPSNPLTARVTVNRFWQMVFGTGLVKTVEDFGSQGEWPSHPELLDWLATEFVRSGWDVKAMQKLIVTSATYRQSSKVREALLRIDPENRLLARAPRLRLSAEMIRDQALAVSGLLVETLGGPSVKPYQPDGLWQELADTEYIPDSGPGLYRRSLYTFWKRTVPPPGMANFDAPAREMCEVRETRTNTPLQALNLMNDVAFVEASRVLAQRVMRDGGAMPKDRLRFAFRLATAREPSSNELSILLDGWNDHLTHFQTDVEAARQLVQVGEFPTDATLDPSELAAYTAVANLILNLDETMTKE